MEQRRWREIKMDEVEMNYKRRGEKKKNRTEMAEGGIFTDMSPVWYGVEEEERDGLEDIWSRGG